MPIIDAPSPLVAPIVTGLFDQGDSYSTFRSTGTTDWLLIYTLEGRGMFRIDESCHYCLPGDFHLVQPGTVHDYRTAPTPGRWQFYWAHFLPLSHWYRYLSLNRLNTGLHSVAIDWALDQSEVLTLLATMNEQSAVGSQFAKELAMNALEAVLIRAFYMSLQIVKQFDSRIGVAVGLICSDLSQSRSLTELAAHCGLSVSRFSNLFRIEMGLTSQQYTEMKRMERARQLLALTGITIQEISIQVGFESAFYFSNRFKAFMGIAPSEFRRLSQLDPDSV